MLQPFATVTVVVTVIRVREEVDQKFELLVADEHDVKDIQIITGCMTVVNPSALPYKQVCGICKLGDIYRQQSGNYHYNLCKLDVLCSFVIHINTTIIVDDAPFV